MAHAVLVTSTIASGRVRAIDAPRAERAPGVVAVISHVNAMRLPQAGKAAVKPPDGPRPVAAAGRPRRLQQPADRGGGGRDLRAGRRRRRARARHVRARARALDFDAERRNEYPPDKVNDAPPDTRRGDVEAGLQAAAHRVEAAYTTPFQHHNPMEPHATLASWDGERLSIEDSTQYVAGVRKTLARTFGIAPDACTCARRSSAARSAARARRGRT